MVNQSIMAQFAAAGGQARPGQLPALGVQGMQGLTLQQQHLAMVHQQALLAQMAAGRAAVRGA